MNVVGERPFPVARYRLDWRVTRPVRLPDYAGSMLRGAFGHALRQVACMTRQKICEGCPMLGACAYPAIFAPPPPMSHALQAFAQIPVPYVIEPPTWGARVVDAGSEFTFHIVLIGRALDELPLIVLAWRRALARGIGAGDGTAELMRVSHCMDGAEVEIYSPERGAIAPHTHAVATGTDSAPAPDDITLRFDTPLRLQNNGRALAPHRLDARTLLMALARRASLLAEFHADGQLISDFPALATAAGGLREERHLVWRDWVRYSSRQKQSMALGGVVGEWHLAGNLAPFMPWLRLGQWLHVGKEAAFGLGGYRLIAAHRTDV